MQRIAAFFGLLLFPICLKSQTASFTYKSINNSYCSPDTIQFIPTSTGSPIGYLWDFGNNRKSHSSHPSVIYNNGGTYTVKLIVIYSQGTEEVSNDVVINPTINPSFSYDKNSLCKPGVVNFSATGIGGVKNYNWNFDDETVSDITNKDINHFFATYRDFNVTLTVTSTSGCISSSSTNITIQKPQIAANVSTTQGCIPATSNFDATVSVLPGDGVSRYLWKFGDGTLDSTSGNNASHTYSMTGKFLPSLEVTTNAGCMNSFIFDSVGFGIPPTNLIAYAEQNVICGSETAVFIGKATNALSYTWDNGESIDEVTGNISKHKYSTLGNKNIIVTPSFNGCVGNSDSFNINVIGVIAKFELRNRCDDKRTFNFTNRSLGNKSSIIWDFGDGSPQDNSVNTRHTYADIGAYVVTLTVHDNITGCSDSLKQLISIADPVLVNPDQSVCRNDTTTFTVLNVYPDIASKYIWNVIGKTPGLGSNNILNIKADQFGTFNATDNIVVINNGGSYCPDTIQLNHVIVVKGPIVNFTSKDTICLGTLLDFTNNSKPYIPGETIVSWDWNFSDGSIHDRTAQPEPHEYSNPGTYNVSLTASDINECTDVFTKIVSVGDNGFVYVLPKSDTLCSGQSKMLIAYQNDSLMWSPASFVSCPTCDTVLVNPTRTTMFYATSTNSFGCSATDSALVKVYLPFIATTPEADLYICPNESVQLDVTPPFYEIMWNPPTGLSDPNIYSPVASPTVSTTYTATLSDSVGCFSSSVDINVHLKSLPTVDAGPDKFYPFYSSFTISPVYSSNVVSYLWSPANDLNCTTCANPSGIITETQTYTIAVTSDSGCVAKDQIMIYVECKDADLLLPTAFTPNYDNINDVFYPLTRGIKTILNFSIYNRQGQLVFHNKNFPPNNKSYGWDGRVKGEPNSTAVFVYIIEALCDTNERIAKKGSFVLIK